MKLAIYVTQRVNSAIYLLLLCGVLFTFNANAAQSTLQAKNSLAASNKTPPQKKSRWEFVRPYEATYDVHYDGDKLGSATRRLSNNNGKWKLNLSSKLKKWLLSLKSTEYSIFQLTDKDLITSKFYSRTKITFKKEKVIEQNYDWKTRQETGHKGKKKWQLPLEEYLFDRMNHLLKIRSDLIMQQDEFKYLVSYKGRRKVYHYTKSENEKLSTHLGVLETVRLDRTSGDDSRFSVWLSPQHDYIPVKIARVEQDKPDVTLLINHLDIKPALAP